MIKKYFFVALILVSFMFAPLVLAADPYYGQQWYLEKIKVEPAWEITKGNSNLVVAVLDTGVDLDHSDLQGNLWVNAREYYGDNIDNDSNGFADDYYGWDFVNNKPLPSPILKYGYSDAAVHHGTMVSGLISAVHDNNIGIKGVTANVKIMPLVVLSASGYGSSSAVAKAIDYAVAMGASIINLSFGGYEHNDTLKKSIINAFDHGVLIVAAAGNTTSETGDGKDLTDRPAFPICYDQEFSENRILGVGATDKDNKVARFTNYGRGCIDIAAPGTDMVGLLYQDASYPNLKDLVGAGWDGSSFSAALVTGAAALLKSARMSLTPRQIIDTLMSQSGLLFLNDIKYKDKMGAGVLDIKRAMESLGLKSSTPSTGAAINLPPVLPGTGTSVFPGGTSSSDKVTTLLVARQAGGEGVIQFYDHQLQLEKQLSIFSGTQFKGLNFVLADVNGDGQRDIVAGAVKGAQPFVRAVTTDGVVLASFLAFKDNFRGGVEVAAGDVDKDGQMEIMAAPQSDYEPVVRVFNLKGQLENELLVYNKTYKNGLNVVCGDVDGDGAAEIVVAPHQGLMPKVKIYTVSAILKKTLTVYVPQFLGGVNLGLADMDNDGKLDIITGAGSTGGPHVQVFNYQGQRLASFLAYKDNFRGGVEVTGGDWDQDGVNDIITAAGPSGSPHVRVFNLKGNLLAEVFAGPANFTQGINIAVK